MPFQRKVKSNFPLDGQQAFVTADGLDDFIKILEKDFYAEVKVQCHYHTSTEKTDLILDLYCNFGLTESLHHFNKGNWGGFACDLEGAKGISSFDAAFQKLSKVNKNAIDIAELSLHFRDTSIIVSRISDYSIPQQLAAIIFKTSAHFVYLTKGLTEMPYEIFVPVFEDHTRSVLTLEKNNKSYFDYWGLYFDDDLQHDVIVYNLKTKQLRKEDFFLLD
ncbi:hypothetical protein DKG77_10430 [Flagellimonas aquimarina]|uniref:Uncharacterized protein n=1 Tax=Flagellimonas aquimarina TaxID=2201895 RepID=A0A316KYK8_9FLAO|nr:hypothetical protein [Allomuricauda koreensis]PWL38661.1 hypothetical protein DKG77_10430 [Allomuricauda koreensis]